MFPTKYKLTDLIYFEDFPDIYQAIDREKYHKNWRRDWKINLIKSVNPEMNDLFWEIRYIEQMLKQVQHDGGPANRK